MSSFGVSGRSAEPGNSNETDGPTEDDGLGGICPGAERRVEFVLEEQY